MLSLVIATLSTPCAVAAEKNYAFAFINRHGDVKQAGGEYAIRGVKIMDDNLICVLVEKKDPKFNWKRLPVLVTAVDIYDGLTIGASTWIQSECQKRFDNEEQFPVSVIIQNRNGEFVTGDFSILIPQ